MQSGSMGSSEEIQRDGDGTSSDCKAGSGDICTAKAIAGRSEMKKIIEQDCPPTAICYEYIAQSTEEFAQENRLGRGAFGEVYGGKDSVLNMSFAVKRILCNFPSGAKQDTLKKAQKHFRQEIETLTYFRHPNIARLYAYYLDSNVSGRHCLVYELAQRGSLDNFLRHDSAREKLPWFRRLHVALDISKALCYLHKGGRGFNCYHRDVKSANICVTRNYTAKLIDCGLSKLIADEGSQAAMTLSSHTTGASVTGTRGYICPKYNRTAVFTSQSEIFSFGIVLVELATGKLQNHKLDGIQVDFFDRYIDDDSPASLQDEFDQCAGHWSENSVIDFSSLALDCIAAKPINRPTIKDVVTRLRRMAQKYCELSPSENSRLLYDKYPRHDPMGHGSLSGEGTCQVCFFDNVHGLKCASTQYPHFICNNCFEEHVLQHANDDKISCPIRWCSSSPFSKIIVQSHMTKETLLTLHQKRTLDKMSTFVELMYQNLREIYSSTKEVNENLNKIQRGQLSLASGRLGCPALFIITPMISPGGFLSDPKSWFVSAFQDTFCLYFLCGHDMSPIKSKIEVKMTRQWVQKMAPILKVALVAIQLSMKATLAVSPDLLTCIPFEGSNQDKVDAMQKAIHPFIDKLGGQCCVQLDDIADQEDFRECREEVYPFIEGLAREQTEWRKEMVQVTSPGGIFWVKKENERFYLPEQLPIPRIHAPIPLHTNEEEKGDDIDRPLQVHSSNCCPKNLKRKRICLSFIIMTVIVIAAATIGGLLGKMATNEGEVYPRPSEAVKGAETGPSRLDVVKSVIINGSISSRNALQDQSSPQYSAATWLASNDTSQVSLDDSEWLIHRYVLAVFYYSTGGDGWKIPHGFMSGTHECDWHTSGGFGVMSCDAKNRTTVLKFGYTGLTGSIPSEVGVLSHLTVLDIRNESSLTGSLPSEVGTLTNLVELRLGSNSIDGEIPSAIGMLSSLSLLDLHDNNLVGTVPSTLVHLSSLTSITLEGNNLTGDLTAFCDAWDGMEYFSADLSKVTCSCCHCCNANATVAASSSPISAPPTPSPTKSPTSSSQLQHVSDVPSYYPTTPLTTESPNKLPTISPSRSPLEPPTQSPETLRPTAVPSLRPTPRPTDMPSRRITSRPTRRPTQRPTTRPTESPTAMPSKKTAPSGSSVPGYPNCRVKHPEWIGSGACTTGEYNTEECGWDGGDCVEFNEHYRNCIVAQPAKIGNGICSGVSYNTEECGWDGGDCVEFNELYPNCRAENPSRVGDGDCHGGLYNTEGCGWDGGDCIEFNERYPNCRVDCLVCVGDGFCHGNYNTEECGYDGGDCCEESCEDGNFWKCGFWYHCVDPKYRGGQT